VSRYIGGTGAITDALEKCVAHYGGEVRCSAVVDQILIRQGAAAGVRLSTGEEILASSVISAANIKTTLQSMLPEGTLDGATAARVAHIPTSGTHASSFKLDLALDGQIDLTGYQQQRKDRVDVRKPAIVYTTFEEHVAAWHACARGEMPDPLPMITLIPTAADPTQAPAGNDTIWSWTGIAPANPRAEWKDVGEDVADREIRRAARVLPGIDGHEIARRHMTPPDFAERFRVPDGNVYHVDPTALRFGPLRPAIGMSGYRSPLPGLFLSGGSMHPSAGICGVPGRQAARTTLRFLQKSK
jgi:phytoene dehydrogenase-like protein